MTVMLYGSARLVRRWPYLINIPMKKKFQSLSPGEREPIMRQVEEYLYWCCVPLNIMWSGAQYGVYRIAVTGSAADNLFMGYIFAGALLTIVVMTIAFCMRMSESVKKAYGTHRLHEPEHDHSLDSETGPGA